MTTLTELGIGLRGRPVPTGEVLWVRHLEAVAPAAKRGRVARRTLCVRLHGVHRVSVDEVRPVRHARSVTIGAVIGFMADRARGDVSHPVRRLPFRTVGDGEGGLDPSRARTTLVTNIARHVVRGEMTLKTVVHLVRAHPSSRAAVGDRGMAVGAGGVHRARCVIDLDTIGRRRSLKGLLVTGPAPRVRYRCGVAVRGTRTGDVGVKRSARSEDQAANSTRRNVAALALDIRMGRRLCGCLEGAPIVARRAGARMDHVGNAQTDEADDNQRNNRQDHRSATSLVLGFRHAHERGASHL